MEFKEFLESKFSEIGNQLSYNGATMLNLQKEVSTMANRQVGTESTLNEQGVQIATQGVTLTKHGEQLGSQQSILSSHGDTLRELKDEIMDQRRRTYKK
jgi:hypothetical protein